MSAQAGAALRAEAAAVVAEVLAGRSLDAVLPAAAERVDARDRALLFQLCYGCLRLSPLLLGVSKRLLTKPLKARDLDLQALLLLGLYQLEATRIPAHAAISATVSAAATRGKHWARGLLNACLRRFQRERTQLVEALEPALRAAHPPWLYAAFAAQWPQQLDALLEAGNSQPPMCLRVNLQRHSRAHYLKQLQAAGLAARPGVLGEAAIYLEQAVPVETLPGFAEGAVSVQDESAQLAATLLAPAAGERVLDACSAPGGKACHLLEREPGIELVAADSDAGRLTRVTENLERLGLRAQTLCLDATQAAQRWQAQPFDRILLDAPCSASGVIRRHPDIKLLRTAADPERFAVRQLALIEGLWPALKPGGVLLYATCSVLREENADVLERFMNSMAGQVRVEALPSGLGQDCGPGRQILPDAGAGDGLYYALLRKTPA